MRNKKNTFNDFKKVMDSLGLEILSDESEYRSSKDKMIVTNGVYKAIVRPDLIFQKPNYKEPRWFSRNNPFVLDNLNADMQKSNKNIVCLTPYEEYIDRNQKLKFKCCDCGVIFYKSLFRSINRDSDHEHNGVLCPACTHRRESLHAYVLKQMFEHYYPDTVFEDRSCTNPLTGLVMPTDIVNYGLKTVVEIQSEYHDDNYQKRKDEIKKTFWEDKGFKVYTPDIRDYTVLEMCQIFFDITNIPEWIVYNDLNNTDWKKVQNRLNSGEKVVDIANSLGISCHCIYDALHSRKIFYPSEYEKSNRVSVVQLSIKHEYIKTYGSFSEAEKDNGIAKGLIASGVYQKSYYACGFYWVPESLYYSNDFVLPENRLEKFYVPVISVGVDGKPIKRYDDILAASKDLNIIAFKIYEVATGIRKTIKGYKFVFE